MSAWRARNGGVGGIYCSNHGGRQANGLLSYWQSSYGFGFLL